MPGSLHTTLVLPVEVIELARVGHALAYSKAVVGVEHMNLEIAPADDIHLHQWAGDDRLVLVRWLFLALDVKTRA